MSTYQIVRFRFDAPREVIRTGLTLEEAQEHCNDEETHGDGWFDGYEEVDDSDYTPDPWGEQQGQVNYLETRYDSYYGED